MSIKETIPFNFDENYEYIAKKFTDLGYDYQDGSNTMQLVTAMSYLVSMLNANTAININETLLPLARKRNMILEGARALGYELEHIRSFQYNITLEFTNDTPNPVNKFIQKYETFVEGDNTYNYMGEDLEIVVPAAIDDVQGTAQVTITVIEGDLKRFSDNADTLRKTIDSVENENGELETRYYIDIPFTDVEDNSTEIYLTYYDEYGIFHEQELWSKSTSFMIDKDTILEKEYVRIDNIDYGTPRIYFKLGDVGKELRVGTIVEMNIIQSNGANGKMTALPSTSLSDAEVVDFTLELEGADEESSESIQANAPLFHNTANRVITNQDYVSFCNRQAKVKTSVVWDGNNELPRVLGNVWFSFISANQVREIINFDVYNTLYTMQDTNDSTKWFLDQGRTVNGLDDDIQEIYNTLDNFKIPTLVFNHRNPIYFDFDYDISIVKYNAAKTKAERNDAVFNVINNYFRGEDDNGVKTAESGVESFGFEYFQSNLNKRIDSELTDLMGFNIELKTSIPLYEQTIFKETRASNDVDFNEEIRFHLGFPYEDVFNENDDIITDNLPQITTELFDDTNDLTVDFDSVVYDAVNKVTSYDVNLGSNIVGTYRVFGNNVDDIEVILYVQTTNGYATGITIGSDTKIDVKYKTPNIRFIRNTIPRLNSVKFN